MKICLLQWQDAYHSTGEVSREDAVDNHLTLFTCGHLIEQNKEAIKVALDYCPETDDYRELAVIPMKYVVSLITLDIDTLHKKPTRRKKK